MESFKDSETTAMGRKTAGLSGGDYVEHVTYQLFLKLTDKQARRPFNRPAITSRIPTRTRYACSKCIEKHLIGR